MTLGDKIKNIRQNADMRQAELAEKLGVSTSAVGNWENNLNKPNVDLISNMCYIFNVSPNYFFDIKNSPEPDEADAEEFAIQLYDALISAGFLKPGQDLTDKQLSVLDGIAAILSATFDDLT